MVRVKTQNNGSLTVTFLCFVLLVERYLNGKLDDDTKYAVFQRSFHTDNDYENEGFIVFTTNKDNTAAVVAGVVVSLVVVAVIVVVVILYIRRRNRDKAADGEDVPMNSKPARTKSVSGFFRRSGIGELFSPKGFFGIRDFPYLKHGIFTKIGAKFGIESIHGRWNAETEEPSGLRDCKEIFVGMMVLKNIIGDSSVVTC